MNKILLSILMLASIYGIKAFADECGGVVPYAAHAAYADTANGVTGAATRCPATGITAGALPNTVIVSSIQAGTPLNAADIQAGTISNAITFGSTPTVPSLVFSGTFTLGVTTPTIAGQLSFTSSYVLYVGTGTSNAYQWAKIGAQ
jgi:hypothetical protein